MFPVVPQHHEQSLAQHHVSVLAAFSCADMDEHAVGVNIASATQTAGFGDPQACGVGNSDNGPVLDGVHPIDDGHDFFMSQYVGQGFGDLGIGNSFYLLGSVESHSVEEFYRCDKHLSQSR